MLKNVLRWRVSDVELDGDGGGEVAVAVPRRHGVLARVAPPRAAQRQQRTPLQDAAAAAAVLPCRLGRRARREGPGVVDLRRVAHRPQADVDGLALDDGVAAERLRTEVGIV